MTRRLRMECPPWHLAYGPGISSALERLPGPMVQHLRRQLEDLVELAQVAPLPHTGWTGSGAPPPLHFTVEDYLVGYVLDPQTRQLVVTDIQRL